MCYVDFTAYFRRSQDLSRQLIHGAIAATVHWFTVLTGIHLHLGEVERMWNKISCSRKVQWPEGGGGGESTDKEWTEGRFYISYLVVFCSLAQRSILTSHAPFFNLTLL